MAEMTVPDPDALFVTSAKPSRGAEADSRFPKPGVHQSASFHAWPHGATAVQSLCWLALLVSWATVTTAADTPRPVVEKHLAVFTAPPQRVPTQGMPDGPLVGNGDVGVALAGPPEAQRFHLGKNDFWRRNDASVIAVGTIHLQIPALQGASYRQEQDLARAEVRGTFSKPGLTVQTRSWVDPNENLLLTSLHAEGPGPVGVSLRSEAGSPSTVPTRIADNPRRLNVGRELHGGSRWYFDGVLDDVRVHDRALSPEEIRRVMAGETLTPPAAVSWPKGASQEARVAGGEAVEGKIGPTIRFDGKKVFAELPVPRLEKALTVTAWIKIESTSPEANYIVSKGEWNEAYSLGLSNGRLRWALGGVVAQTKQPLALHKWLHVAGTFDGRQMCVYVDGELQARLGDGSGGGEVEERLATSCFARKADTLPGRCREVAVATRLLGATAHANDLGGLQFMLQPGTTVVVASAVWSDLDTENCMAAAKQRVAALSLEALESLSARHQKWWAEFWARSFLEIPDQEIEKRWYAALYVIASCSRAGKVAPGLWGNWITTDHPNWHGDFHLNYNFQAPFYPVYSANHADLSLPFYQAILEAVPAGRRIAQQRGWKGVHFPVSIGPWGLLPEGPDADWGQRSDAAFAALNFIWHYQYTQDTDFLRATAYPYLRAVADFWEDYLRLEQGRYVIHNDSIHEGSGQDMNPLLSLGLVRTLFGALLPMSVELGLDADRRAKWQDIRDKISAFPLQERNGRTVFRYSEKGMAWCDGNTLGIHHIFPAGAIGLESDSKLLEISRQTIAAMSRWHDNNGFSSWYTACARVGYDPKTILANLRKECDQRSYPNLLLYYGGGGIENVAGFLAINEMLFQSHEGVLRFFPVWPKEQNARFGGLRAVGAFLVSAELNQGVVRGVTIRSEKGRPCTVRNPWPGRTVQVVRGGKAAELVTGDRFTMKTAAGETIELGPRRSVQGAESGEQASPSPAPQFPRLALERHLTLAPQPGNPRNSEGDFIQLKNGRWLFIYTHFTGGASDHAKAFLAARQSSDGGVTWGDTDTVVVPNEGGCNIMSVSLLRLNSGAIALFYLRKNSLQDCRPVLRFSLDEAQTWSAPLECIPEAVGYYVLNNNRVIQLASGRLVVPTALHGFAGGSLLPGTVVVHLSDDLGKTWRRGRSLLDQDAEGTRINFMEPGVVEVAPNRLRMVIRTRLGCQYLSESSDGGETWARPKPSELLSPEAPATLARIPSTGDLLAVWNNQAGQTEAYRRTQPPIRRPLGAALSRDGGRTWEKPRLLEDQPGHGYCYTAIAFAGERVLLAYCAHASPFGLQTTQISSFRLQDLYR